MAVVNKLNRFWAWLLGLIGCTPVFVATTVHGVPNLTQVAPRLWRMGQPADAVAWAYVAGTLANGRPITVVKLNDDAEGSDAPATGLGMTLIKRPLPPEDNKPWTVFDKPDPREVRGIVQVIIDAYNRGDTVIWHCTAGRDRTGLITALVGMKLFGWSKDDAWKNMLAHGFRWELPDLDAYWLENVN